MVDPSKTPSSFERKAARAYGRGCFRLLLVQLVGLFLGLGLVAWALWFVARPAVAGDATRGSILLATAAPILVLVISLTLVAVTVVGLRGRRLDRAFRPWCGEGRQSGPAMRGWSGHYGSRRLDAWVSRGPKVELYLDCAARTRAWINRGGVLMRRVNRLLHKEPTPIPAASRLGVSVYADDPDWVERLFEHETARSAIETLLREDPPQTSTALNLQPEALQLMKIFVPVGAIDRGRVELWLRAMEQLAETVEALPAPASPELPSRQEEWVRTDRGAEALNRILIWIFGVGLFLLMAFILLFTYVLPIGGGGG